MPWAILGNIEVFKKRDKIEGFLKTKSLLTVEGNRQLYEQTDESVCRGLGQG